MSSGPFVSSRYESELGSVHRIKVQPETLSLSLNSIPNDPTLTAVDSPFSARVSGSRRGYGAYARTVTVRFLEGDAPVGYQDEAIITLPWLVAATFRTLVPGATGNYLGGTVELISKRAEKLA